MALTPLDIHNKEFRKGLRGYVEAEVDDFLDEIIKEFEALIRENARLKDEVDKYKGQLERYQQLEQTLHNTLIVAQETAEEVKSAARKEAELALREAEIKAGKIVDEGYVKVRKIVAENEEIRRQTQIMKTRMRTLLHAQLELLGTAEEEQLQAGEQKPEAS